MGFFYFAIDVMAISVVGFSFCFLLGFLKKSINIIVVEDLITPTAEEPKSTINSNKEITPTAEEHKLTSCSNQEITTIVQIPEATSCFNKEITTIVQIPEATSCPNKENTLTAERTPVTLYISAEIPDSTRDFIKNNPKKIGYLILSKEIEEKPLLPLIMNSYMGIPSPIGADLAGDVSSATNNNNNTYTTNNNNHLIGNIFCMDNNNNTSTTNNNNSTSTTNNNNNTSTTNNNENPSTNTGTIGYDPVHEAANQLNKYELTKDLQTKHKYYIDILKYQARFFYRPDNTMLGISDRQYIEIFLIEKYPNVYLEAQRLNRINNTRCYLHYISINKLISLLDNYKRK
jgi:hypothetical protein